MEFLILISLLLSYIIPFYIILNTFYVRINEMEQPTTITWISFGILIIILLFFAILGDLFFDAESVLFNTFIPLNYFLLEILLFVFYSVFTIMVFSMNSYKPRKKKINETI